MEKKQVKQTNDCLVYCKCLWRNVKTGELSSSTNSSAHDMPKGSWWVDMARKSTWLKINDEDCKETDGNQIFNRS